ncbi:MAG: hypothetical protein AAFY27_04175, partial [Pseudomonadota bacterium]
AVCGRHQVCPIAEAAQRPHPGREAEWKLSLCGAEPAVGFIHPEDRTASRARVSAAFATRDGATRGGDRMSVWSCGVI